MSRVAPIAPVAPVAPVLPIAPVHDGDHDILITFRAEAQKEFGNIREDIKKLNDGTSAQISNHETRLTAIEAIQNQQMGSGSGIKNIWTWIFAAISAVVLIANFILPRLK